jgi:hypothetical protein
MSVPVVGVTPLGPHPVALPVDPHTPVLISYSCLGRDCSRVGSEQNDVNRVSRVAGEGPNTTKHADGVIVLVG